MQICLQILKESICENENYSVMSASTSIILDTRRMKKKDTFPVKLQVTHQRVTNHYQTIFDLSKEDYEKLTAPRISGSLQNIRDKLKLLQRNCEYYINEISHFSFYEFIERSSEFLIDIFLMIRLLFLEAQ